VTRAFTLVEVLVATVLLALIAAVTLPYFQSASEVLGNPDRTVEKVTLLASAASLIMASPEWERARHTGTLTFACPQELMEPCQRCGMSDPIVVRFPDPPEADDSHAEPRTRADEQLAESARSATVETRGVEDSSRLEPTEDASEARSDTRTLGVAGAWIEFRCGEVAVHRWLAHPKRDRGQRRPRKRLRALMRARRDRRAAGMTLVEVVVALALLGTLAVAAAGWTTTAAQLARVSTSHSNQRAAAHAALRVIADDLRSWDAGASAHPARRPARNASRGSHEAPPRVIIEGDTLVVRTRDPAGKAAVAEHRYAVRASTTLERSNSQGQMRPLVQGVKALIATHDEKSGLLTVALELDDGYRLERAFLVP